MAFLFSSRRKNLRCTTCKTDIRGKFAFSHLYTALTRPGYREFLGLPDEWRAEDPKPNPVPKNKLENLHKVMVWLYGSKKDEIEPIINSQNPDIKNLGAVLLNARAR